MSSGTNSERILENNEIITDNNTAIDNFATAISNLPQENTISFAQMITNFDSRSYTYTGWLQKVTGWTKYTELGDYQVDTTNSRIIIENTTLLEIFGSTGGNGYGEITYDIVDTDGNSMLTDYSTKMLYQFGGNYFWRANLQTCIVQLDPTKTYYLSLYAKGYNNKNFVMNDGFGASSTWLSALKLK